MPEHVSDMLYRAASVWNELTEYIYVLTYGYKNNLYTLRLTFSYEDFPHLAGFQYLKDISFPRYSNRKIIPHILDHSITLDTIRKSINFNKMVLPRLEALSHIKNIFDSDFQLFSYVPRMYPFYTRIQADYLISHSSTSTYFIFLIQTNADGSSKCDYLCCSTFKQTERNYKINQRSRTLLKKERIHLPSTTSVVLLDRLSNSP